MKKLFSISIGALLGLTSAALGTPTYTMSLTAGTTIRVQYDNSSDTTSTINRDCVQTVRTNYANNYTYERCHLGFGFYDTSTYDYNWNYSTGGAVGGGMCGACMTCSTCSSWWKETQTQTIHGVGSADQLSGPPSISIPAGSSGSLSDFPYTMTDGYLTTVSVKYTYDYQSSNSQPIHQETSYSGSAGGTVYSAQGNDNYSYFDNSSGASDDGYTSTSTVHRSNGSLSYLLQPTISVIQSSIFNGSGTAYWTHTPCTILGCATSPDTVIDATITVAAVSGTAPQPPVEVAPRTTTDAGTTIDVGYTRSWNYTWTTHAERLTCYNNSQ